MNKIGFKIRYPTTLTTLTPTTDDTAIAPTLLESSSFDVVGGIVVTGVVGGLVTSLNVEYLILCIFILFVLILVKIKG